MPAKDIARIADTELKAVADLPHLPLTNAPCRVERTLIGGFEAISRGGPASADRRPTNLDPVRDSGPHKVSTGAPVNDTSGCEVSRVQPF
jgi:hypothetical protein